MCCLETSKFRKIVSGLGSSQRSSRPLAGGEGAIWPHPLSALLAAIVTLYLQVNWKTLIAFCVDSRNRQQPQHGLQQPKIPLQPLQPQPMAVGASPVYNEIGFERKNEQYEIPVLKAASAEPHIYDNLIHQ